MDLFLKQIIERKANSPFYRVRCSGKNNYKHGKWSKNNIFKRCCYKDCTGLVVYDICNSCGTIQTKVDYSDSQIQLIQEAIERHKLIKPAGGLVVNHFKHCFTYDSKSNLCFWYNTTDKSTHIISENKL